MSRIFFSNFGVAPVVSQKIVPTEDFRKGTPESSTKTPTVIGDKTDRLQLKRGLFWYGNQTKMHEMAEFTAGNWTDLCKMSMCVFFDSTGATPKLEKKQFIQKNLITLD